MENSKLDDAVCCFVLFFVFQTLWRTQSWMMLFVVLFCFCVSDIMENSKMNDDVCCFLCFRHYGELKDE